VDEDPDGAGVVRQFNCLLSYYSQVSWKPVEERGIDAERPTSWDRSGETDRRDRPRETDLEPLTPRDRPIQFPAHHCGTTLGWSLEDGDIHDQGIMDCTVQTRWTRTCHQI